MMTKEEIDYKLAAEQLHTGKPLFGKDGALAPMLERILNAALEGEMDAHLVMNPVHQATAATARCRRLYRRSMVR